jgi:hemerythrin
MLIEAHEIQKVADEVMNMLHEEELELINNFHDAILAKDIDKIDELFKVVLADVETHFKTEEDMMQQNNYSHFQVHKSDHDLMRKKLAKFHKRWEVLKGPTEVQNFLEKDFKKWLISHVGKWDTETALHLSNG